MKKSINLNDIIVLFVVSVYFLSFSFSSFFLKFSPVASIFSTSLCLILFLLNFKRIINSRKKFLFVVLFNIIFLLFGLTYNNTGMGSLLQMFTSIIILLIITEITISDKLMKIIKFLIPIFFVLFLISDKNYLNPNFVGYLYLLFYLYFLNIFDVNFKDHFLIWLTITIFTVYLLFATECRTSLLGILVYNIFTIIPIKKIDNKIIKRTIPIVLIFGNLLFSYVYIQLWKNHFYIDLSFFTKKRLFSGRNYIWYESFELIKNYPWFGIGSKYRLRSIPAYALHNSMHMIMTTFGIPNIVFYYLLFNDFISSIYLKKNYKKNFIHSLAVIVALYVIDFFEGYLFWTEYNMLFLCLIIMILNKKDWRVKNESLSS